MVSNVVLVKKSLRKWMICIDYTYPNRACLIGSYPLLNIYKIMDNLVGYKLLSFMDAYSRYNQIPMFRPDGMKTTFMIE